MSDRQPASLLGRTVLTIREGVGVYAGEGGVEDVVLEGADGANRAIGGRGGAGILGAAASEHHDVAIVVAADLERAGDAPGEDVTTLKVSLLRGCLTESVTRGEEQDHYDERPGAGGAAAARAAGGAAGGAGGADDAITAAPAGASWVLFR